MPSPHPPLLLTRVVEGGTIPLSGEGGGAGLPNAWCLPCLGPLALLCFLILCFVFRACFALRFLSLCLPLRLNRSCFCLRRLSSNPARVSPQRRGLHLCLPSLPEVSKRRAQCCSARNWRLETSGARTRLTSPWIFLSLFPSPLKGGHRGRGPMRFIDYTRARYVYPMRNSLALISSHKGGGARAQSTPCVLCPLLPIKIHERLDGLGRLRESARETRLRLQIPSHSPHFSQGAKGG